MNVVCEIMYKEKKKLNYIYLYSGLMTEKDVVFMSYSSSSYILSFLSSLASYSFVAFFNGTKKMNEKNSSEIFSVIKDMSNSVMQEI